MAICDNAKRISDISHGLTSLAQPVGGGVTETVDWIENRPGTSTAPECAAIDRYDCTARAVFQGLVTPIARGTSATLTYSLEEFDGGTATVAVANMLAGASSFDFDTPPYRQTQEFKYKGSSLAPITVTV